MPSIQALFNVLQTQGQARYGSEAVTQEQHALQCATLAENAQASPRLITACLFHDLGHLVHALGESAIARGINNRHEECALPYLTKLFFGGSHRAYSATCKCQALSVRDRRRLLVWPFSRLKAELRVARRHFFQKQNLAYLSLSPTPKMRCSYAYGMI